MLFHGSDYSSVFIVEQRYYSVNAFEIFVRRNGAQGCVRKKGVSGLFKVSSVSPVGWDCYVVKADPFRHRLPDGSTTLTSRRTSG
jgi:hypothetical protein